MVSYVFKYKKPPHNKIIVRVEKELMGWESMGWDVSGKFVLY